MTELTLVIIPFLIVISLIVFCIALVGIIAITQNREQVAQEAIVTLSEVTKDVLSTIVGKFNLQKSHAQKESGPQDG